MARNRQRARDRKRRAQQGNGGDDANLHAGEAPENTSGEVDEFEAALQANAGGEPADVDASELEAEALQARGDLDGDGTVDQQDAALAAELASAAPAPRTARVPAPGAKGGPRFVQFIRGSWAELQRVQWPDRRQVAQATAVVLGFVVIAGAYLGLADYVAKKVVNFIL